MHGSPDDCRLPASDSRLNILARLPYAVAGQLATLASHVAPPAGGKVMRSFALRRGATDRIVAWARSGRDPKKPLLWMHAPSVGEGLMAAPVIERIRRSRPQAQVLYTFFSPSAEALASGLPVDFAGILPFDTSGASTTLLDAVRPSALVFSKLDVWPLLAESASARGIPVALISASLASDSGRRSQIARLLLADAYGALSAVGAVHAEDAERLGKLGVHPDRITVTGDTRYDQVWARMESRQNADLIVRLASPRPTLVAGSTWNADELHLASAFDQIRQSVPGLRIIVAPHEPNDGARLQMESAARGRWSVAPLDLATRDTDLVWVDRMGVLADLYALATVAYVGGGFHDKGLHSVVEPAAHGVPVVFGPRHESSRDAIALKNAGGGFAVDARSLGEQLRRLLTDTAARTRAADSAREVIRAGLGAADRSSTLIERFL